MGHGFSKRFNQQYLRKVGLSPTDQGDLRQAYETAHRIREFEIDLYWRRTAYVWAMQAALIGLAVFLASGGTTTIAWNNGQLIISTSPSLSNLVFLLGLSVLALAIAIIWLILLLGAKFWHNNWERHVDILGQHLGENLYQVYPLIKEQRLPPFSVSKLNRLIVWAFIAFWAGILTSTLLAIADSLLVGQTLSYWIAVMILFMSGLVIAYCWLVQFKFGREQLLLRMDDIGQSVKGLSFEEDGGEIYVRSDEPSNGGS